MIKQISVLPGIILLTAVASHAVTPSAAQTRADFERMAGEMPYLAVDSVLRDCDHFFKVATDREHERHTKILAESADPKYSKDALLDLLGHADAKVRTLAAVALFDREDPSVLPALAKLADDNAPTFNGHPELLREERIYSGIGPPQRKQTVGYVAKQMIGFYMERYRLYDAIEPGFTEYWRDRKDRWSAPAGSP